jgi:hypothetical protein
MARGHVFGLFSAVVSRVGRDGRKEVGKKWRRGE